MIKLLELRTEKGLSQREMAALLKISQGTYNNWENGRTQPSIEQLISLAVIFDVSVDYLIGNAEEISSVHFGEMITQEEKLLLKYYRSLDEEAKAALLKLLKRS